MDDHAPAFAPAKLRPPELSIEPLARPKLAAALRSITEVALTLVTAPAGSGKTVGVAEWARAADVPVAWLRLDPSDHEPSRLLAAMLAAVAVARPELRPSTWPEPGPVSFEAWLTRRLLIPLAEHGGSLVITLDEAEVEANGPLARMLEWLLENRSAGLHLCVIGRELPAIPLARLEARGELLRIGIDQLWFGEDQLGGPLYPLTRGWPVAVRLLMQSIREGQLIPREPVDRRVLAYMIEEVVNRLAPELRELLIDTVILDELEPDACVAVSGRADAGERIWAARDVGLLLGGRAGLQVHPLLREALLQRASLDGRAWTGHRRASRFYAARGRIEPALRHGVAGNDVEGLAKLARERGWTMLRAGQLDGLARLLAAVDEAGPIDRADPEDRAVVAVLRAWSALREGPAAARVALGHARHHADADELMQRSLAALEALVELRSGAVARGLALASGALDGLSVEQRGLAVVLRLAIAFAHELAHDWSGALEALARAGQDAAITPALPSLATITAHRVRLLGRLARAREAAELAEVVSARLLELGWDQTPAAGSLSIELAMIELARGRFAEAEQAALRGLASIELGGDAAAHVRGLIGLARIRRARGDTDGVAEALERTQAPRHAAHSRHLAILVAIEERPLSPLDDRLTTLGPLGAMLWTDLRLGRASAWLREPERDPSRLPELIRELERELEAADAEGRRLVSLQARVLLAALSLAHDRDRAEVLFRQAVAQAEPEQLRGPFLAERKHLASFAAALPDWLADLRPTPAQPTPDPLLSERELGLLREIARGLSNQLIASTLHISLATVKTHVHHILAKLEVRNRTEAVHRARSLGLID